jgi:hypothetical protein
MLDLAAKMPSNDITNLLIMPFTLDTGGYWWEADDASVVSVTLIDQTPARAVLDTVIAYPAANVQAHGVYTVYASGRVALLADLLNVGGVTIPFEDAECSYTSVSETLTWAVSNLANNYAAGFFRTDGATPYPNLLAINSSLFGAVGSDAPGNRYWSQGAFNLTAGGHYARTTELQLGPGNQDTVSLTDRANDVLGPGLQVVSGGTALGNGYDQGQGAYVLQAAGTSVQFRPTGAQTRFTPSFVVSGWSAATWSVSLGGEVLVSSAAPIGPHAIAFFDQPGSTLVLVYLRDIPMAAPDAERLFTLEAQ